MRRFSIVCTASVEGSLGIACPIRFECRIKEAGRFYAHEVLYVRQVLNVLEVLYVQHILNVESSRQEGSMFMEYCMYGKY